MAPDVLARKLAYLRQLLADLAPYENASLADVTAEHYKLERIIELMVMTATDVLFHLLAERDVTPSSYRHAFGAAAEQGLLSEDLAEKLQDAASMRNLLVHMYEQIDYTILRDSIKPALRDFGQFVAVFSDSLLEEE